MAGRSTESPFKSKPIKIPFDLFNYDKIDQEKYWNNITKDSKESIKRVRASGRDIAPKKIETNKEDNYMRSIHIYKANSDELSRKRVKKKVKKSVLTLPNQQAPVPHDHTVSDTNDEDYYKSISNDFLSKKIPIECKNTPFKNPKNNSQLKTNQSVKREVQLPNATEMAKKNKRLGNKVVPSTTKPKSPYNIWGMLRSMNRFPFQRSPSLSDTSDKTKKGDPEAMDKFDSDIDMVDDIYGLNIEIRSKSSVLSKTSSQSTVITASSQRKMKNGQKHSSSSSIKTSRVNGSINRNGHHISNLGYITEKNHNTSHSSPIKLSTFVSKKTQNSPKHRKKTKVPPKTQLIFESDDSQQSNSFCPKSSGQSGGPKNALMDNDQYMKGNCNKLLNFVEVNVNKHNTLKLNKSQQRSTKDVKKIEMMHPYKQPIITPNYVPRNSITIKQAIANDILKKEKGLLRYLAKDNDRHPNKATNPISNKNKKLSEDAEKHEVDQQNSIKEFKCSPFDSKSNSLINIADENDYIIKRPSKLRKTTLTVAEIKNKLALIKFPLQVLDKNEISSNFEVVTFDQFAGLDKKMWPFMSNFKYGNSNKFSTVIDMEQEQVETKVNLTRKSTPKTIHLTGKTNDNKSPRLMNGKSKLHTMPTQVAIDTLNAMNSIENLCEEKLQVLFKHDNPGKILNPNKIDKMQETIMNNLKPKSIASLISNKIVDTSFQKHIIRVPVKKDSDTTSSASHVEPKKPKGFGYTWPKASWASDFIDNVITKIKNGIYCNALTSITEVPPAAEQQTPEPTRKETSIQTVPNLSVIESITEEFTESDEDIFKFYDAEVDPLKHMDAFNEEVKGFELTAMNKETVTLKSLVANVVLQFDIVIPKIVDTSKTDTIPNYFPLGETESNTKIFKCTATLVNGVLPAQLCTLIPNLMNRLKELSETKFFDTITLPRIPDTLQLEYTEKPECTSIVPISPKNTSFPPTLTGCFRQNITTATNPKSNFNFNFKLNDFLNILEPESLHPRNFITPLISPTLFNLSCFSKSTVTEIERPDKNNCKTLIPYVPPDSRLYIIMERDANAKLLTIYYNFTTLFDSPLKLIENMDMGNKITEEKVAVTEITSSKKDKTRAYTSKKGFPDNVKIVSNKKKRKLNKTRSSSSKRTKKYKESVCKKKTSTSLNSITSMEQFFKSIVSSKDSLSSVLASNTESLIMSFVGEMKSWTTEITANQSLLLLLLANKKQTNSLVRFRSIVLQAIAVNRITTTSELDMEIEVIENEKFNLVAELNEITESSQNKDSRKHLLDELIWIAKTTASDHKRQFNESSENLLKTLLDKRKQLNPSYLRVMARYVGLGLLKHTKSRTT